MKRLENVDMRQYTSFKAGGSAREMVIVESVEELQAVLQEIDREQKKWLRAVSIFITWLLVAAVVSDNRVLSILEAAVAETLLNRVGLLAAAALL